MLETAKGIYLEDIHFSTDPTTVFSTVTEQTVPTSPESASFKFPLQKYSAQYRKEFWNVILGR